MPTTRQFYLEGTAAIPGGIPIPHRVADRLARRVPANSLADRCWLSDYRTGPDSIYQATGWMAEGRYLQIGTHRLSHLVFIGPIPPGKMVLHRCNNKSCWNPAHLYAGDHFDNARDRVAFERAEAAAGRITRSARHLAAVQASAARRRAIRCEAA